MLPRIKCSTCAWTLLSATFACFAITMLLPSRRASRGLREPPVIIWWTPNFPGESRKITNCGRGSACVFSNDRRQESGTPAAGFLFYGSDFDFLDLPLPRKPQELVWGLLHEESPRNALLLSHAPALQLFNYSSTVSRYSDVPLTLQYLHGAEDLLNLEFFVETADKNELLSEISPVLYLQSDCDTASDRDSYVEELMKHIPVDSYGACLNNRKLPVPYGRDYLGDLNADDFLRFVARYKFTIAFENAICDDYITEKLWRPLKVGSVPVYMGSPSVRDWLPNANSAIVATDFQSPRDLAIFIGELNSHDEEYEKFLIHKINGRIANERLLNFLKARTWTVDDSDQSFAEAFECFICDKIHERLLSEEFQPSVVSDNHYKCNRPIPSLPHRGHFHEWWAEEWETSRKQALTLAALLIDQKRMNYTETDFYNIMYDFFF